MKSIVGANRTDIYIEFALPVDENGDYAFDEKGKPVKGSKPVEVRLPRYDALTRDEFKELMTALEEIGNDEDLDTTDRITAEVRAVLGPFVPEEHLKLIENLRLIEIKQISQIVAEGNSMSVGELLASTRS